MIGDAFGGGTQTVVVSTTTFLDPRPGTTINTATIPRGSGGGSVGQTRLVEGFNPIPHDRVFLNYSYFNAVPLSQRGIDVNRLTPGFEKTFLSGDASVEFRTPMAVTLDSNISGNGATIVNQKEFGDLFTSLKFLMLRTDRFVFTSGLSLTVPTADDIRLLNVPGSTLQELRIHNDAVHLQPFVAFVRKPDDRRFFQGLFQIDVPTSANRVTGQFIGQPEANFGALTNQVYGSISVAMGYWLYQSENNRLITGIAPLIETHYSQTLSTGNRVIARDGNNPALGNATDIVLGDRNYQFQLLNITTGANVQMGRSTSVLLGYSTPLGSGSDQQFNGEFRLLLNHRLGPSVGTPGVSF